MAIGRHPECDIVVDDPTVSRRHAEVRREGGRYVLVDHGSLNGTYVNREPRDRALLADGDELWVGKARFTFHVDDYGGAVRRSLEHSTAVAG
jgi:pSer/pThr/pTyr-binding forkhead associated (FHA) protein